MKKAILLLSLLVLGCIANPNIIIPDRPGYGKIGVYEVEGGICMDMKSLRMLHNNIQAMEDYSLKMRKLLEDLQKSGR